jgi:hypothetical protein
MPLFDECVAFTDIHLGLRNNSREHNNDCKQFVEWMVEEAQKRGIKTCIFLGDFHHVRSSINISTLCYSTNLLRYLSKSFDNVYFIVGNHDMFYKNKREINSIDYALDIPNIHLINDPVVIGEVGFVPWVLEEEWHKITSMKAKYLFGHFEFPSFLLNSKMLMPDHGQFPIGDLTGFDMVFSGHFHKRQRKQNVQYIGNCFPHNFSDVDEESNRGIMFLKWGQKPEFKSWPGTPRYRYVGLSDLIDNPDDYLGEKTYVRVTLDAVIDYEDANFIREMFSELYSLRECTFLAKKRESDLLEVDTQSSDFESVDSVVIGQLQSVDSKIFDSNLLISIYQAL